METFFVTKVSCVFLPIFWWTENTG